MPVTKQPSYFIDGKELDSNRIDETMTLNTVEKRTIRNVTDGDHLPHALHRLHRQVVMHDVLFPRGQRAPMRAVRSWGDRPRVAPGRARGPSRGADMGRAAILAILAHSGRPV